MRPYLEVAKKESVVSFWAWFGLLALPIIPCIGPIVVIVLAFVAANTSVKNHARATLAWWAVLICVYVALLFLPGAPSVTDALKSLQNAAGIK